MARTSMDLRGGASGGEAGSVKAVWKTKRGPPSSFLSYTWTHGGCSLDTWGCSLDTWGCRRNHTGLQVPLLGRYPSLAMHSYLLTPSYLLLTMTTYSLTHLEHEALILGHVRVGVPLVRGRVAQRVVLARAASKLVST